MRFLRHSLTGLFFVALTLALLAYAGSLVRGAVEARLSSEPNIPRARERVFAVNVVQAKLETITPELTAFGEVASQRSLEIRAASAGPIVELAPEFEEGASVTAGQVLARIDPANAQSALDRAKNDLRDAEVAVRDAARAVEIAVDTLAAAEEQAALRTRAYQRQLDLRDRGVGTEAAVETAELAAASARQAVLASRNSLATAETRVESAQTTLSRATIARDEAQRRLDDTTIRAEFTGTLSEVSANEGGLVTANERLGTLIDGQSLEVSFRVSTPQYARLLDGNGTLIKADITVTLEVQGIALTAEGKITRDSAAVAEGQSGRLIFAQLSETHGLKPGDFVTVSITEPPLERVARLPATAVNAAQSILVVSAESRLEELTINVLRRQGDDVLVRGRGLEGRQVVAQRSPLLGAGIRVRPLTPEAAETPPEAPAMVELTPERREKLKAFISASNRLPADVKTRILTQLDGEKVPARMVERIESRMGG